MKWEVVDDSYRETEHPQTISCGVCFLMVKSQHNPKWVSELHEDKIEETVDQIIITE